MPTLIIVHRHKEPSLWGLHSDARTEKYFDAVGLFTLEDLLERLKNYSTLIDVDVSTYPLKKLMSCAPIEWHTAMKEGTLDLKANFQIFITEPDPS